MKAIDFAIVCVTAVAFAHGCQTPSAATVDETAEKDRIAKMWEPVVPGSVTTSGDFERKYNRIKVGMKLKEVEAILGRSFDKCWLPGGSLGNEWCYWFEDCAELWVDFDWGTGKARRKSLSETGDSNLRGSETQGSNAEVNELESKFNQIEKGMSRRVVEAILGREPDRILLPGGSLGGQECSWFEQKGTIIIHVEFECDGTVSGMSLTRNTPKGAIEVTQFRRLRRSSPLATPQAAGGL